MTDDLKLWFPLYFADLLTSRKMRRWDAEQVGIFILLICEQWNGGPLPNDKDELCDMARVPDWSKVQFVLQSQFVLTDKGWINERLVEIWYEQMGKIHQKSRAGKIGAEARWGKKIDPELEPENATAMRPQSDPNANENATAMGCYKVRNSNEKERKIEKRKSKPKRKRFRDDTIYIAAGLSYGTDLDGIGPDTNRGYNEIPVRDFLDMQVFLKDSTPLPDPLVIDSQDILDAWLNHPTGG